MWNYRSTLLKCGYLSSNCCILFLLTFSTITWLKVCCMMKVNVYGIWCKCKCENVGHVLVTVFPELYSAESTGFRWLSHKRVFPEILEMVGNGNKLWAAGTLDPRTYTNSIQYMAAQFLWILFSPHTLRPLVLSPLSLDCSLRVQPDLLQCCSPRSQ